MLAIGPGETLRSISLQYRTSVASIREWNRIQDVTKLYLGQQLLVQKDLPDNESGANMMISPVLGKLALEDTSFLAQNRMSKADLDQRIQNIIQELSISEDNTPRKASTTESEKKEDNEDNSDDGSGDDGSGDDGDDNDNASDPEDLNDGPGAPIEHDNE
ncbi:hypothetical protein DYB28_004225 [Aphanomyces astaci]|uniref:LysM domain-containing protein n=1 Tax=Aphanomyces astaci TaxID=112090 RepID=A0A9X8E8X7_APHAT|nr:hypothetical protein DYB28_004225 [Aphanomyces astaci]